MNYIYAREGSSNFLELSYKLDTIPDGVIRMKSPKPENGDYIAMPGGNWVKRPEPELTEQDYVNAAQITLDNKAREYRYDNIFTAISYEGDNHLKFHNEAVAFKQWRSTVWLHCYSLFDEVTAGDFEQPSLEEFVAGLPEFPGVEA